MCALNKQCYICGHVGFFETERDFLASDWHEIVSIGELVCPSCRQLANRDRKPYWFLIRHLNALNKPFREEHRQWQTTQN